jgi:hypothetical protein
MGLALIFLAFLSLPFGAYAFFSNQLNGTPAATTPLVLWVFVFGAQFTFTGIFSLGATFFFVWAVYVSLFVLMVKGPWYNLVRALRRVATDGTLAIYSSGALTWSFVFPVILLLAVYIDNLLTTAGVPVGSLSTVDARYAFWLNAYAPLVEEVGFRVTIIGFVAVIIAYRVGGGWGSLRALWHPSRTLGSLKVESWKQEGIYAAAVLSAAIFGVQHVIGGWGIGKLLSAFVVGLAFGIVYFTHGLPVAVMLHWGFDYFEYSLFYFDQVRGLPAMTSEFTSLSSLQYAEFYADTLVYIIAFALLALSLYMIGKAVIERRRASRATVVVQPQQA